MCICDGHSVCIYRTLLSPLNMGWYFRGSLWNNLNKTRPCACWWRLLNFSRWWYLWRLIIYNLGWEDPVESKILLNTCNITLLSKCTEKCLIVYHLSGQLFNQLCTLYLSAILIKNYTDVLSSNYCFRQHLVKRQNKCEYNEHHCS